MRQCGSFRGRFGQGWPQAGLGTFGCGSSNGAPVVAPAAVSLGYNRIGRPVSIWIKPRTHSSRAWRGVLSDDPGQRLVSSGTEILGWSMPGYGWYPVADMSAAKKTVKQAVATTDPVTEDNVPGSSPNIQFDSSDS